jgi:thioredoxin 2
MPWSITRRCASCGAVNRVPARHLADTGRCGSCKASLAPHADAIEADAQTFEEIVREARVPVLVDFWADWCGPCKTAAPEVAALAREMAGKALVLKVDTKRQPELSSRYRVQSIPNFVVFRDGRVVMQQAGVVPRAQMRRWLEQAMAA